MGAGTPADLERWSATGRSGWRPQGHTALILGFGLQGAASALSQLRPRQVVTLPAPDGVTVRAPPAFRERGEQLCFGEDLVHRTGSRGILTRFAWRQSASTSAGQTRFARLICGRALGSSAWCVHSCENAPSVLCPATAVERLRLAEWLLSGRSINPVCGTVGSL